MYLIKIPYIIKQWFPKYVWSISTKSKEIYLTFDDGPTPKITEFVLNELKKYNAKATFFCIGNNIVKHPEIFRKIINEEHKIGNHTQNHLNGWTTKTDDYIKNIEQAQKAIQKTIPSCKTNLFRPPYGKIKRKQAKRLLNKGYKIIMWSVLSGDFDCYNSSEMCFKNVVRNTKKGNIIVFHDNEKAKGNMQKTLTKVLAYYSNKGYKFRTLL